MPKFKTGKPDLPKTIVCDIDGTILHHLGKMSDIAFRKPKILKGVLDKFNRWSSRGFVIVLFTGRPESMRQLTQDQLAKFGIPYNQLIMGIGIGARILINDLKPEDPYPTALAINVVRNAGIADIEIL